MSEQPDLSRAHQAGPARFRFTFWDKPAADSTPLEMPARQDLRPVGIVFGVFFVIFAAVLWIMIVKLLHGHGVRGVSDLMGVLFEGFWILGWSVGVFITGALTLLLLCLHESARLQDGRLVQVPRLGPLKVITEFDLALMHNLRLDTTGADEDGVRIRFDYGGGSNILGDAMPREVAEALVATIRAAAPPGAPIRGNEPVTASTQATPPQSRVPASFPTAATSFSFASPAALALIAANLVPLAGVLIGGWGIGAVMVLFWAESAIIGFYTVLKMAVVGKWAVLFATPFFLGHFGAFMAAHFAFVYEFFVRGVDARGPGPAVRDALRDLFAPLWPALAALFISHGVSFAVNFVGRREYVGETMSGLMTAPYKRIVVMHLTIIFGGWLLLALKTPAPALVLLILLKIAVDLHAHRRERAAKTGKPPTNSKNGGA